MYNVYGAEGAWPMVKDMLGGDQGRSINHMKLSGCDDHKEFAGSADDHRDLSRCPDHKGVADHRESSGTADDNNQRMISDQEWEECQRMKAVLETPLGRAVYRDRVPGEGRGGLVRSPRAARCVMFNLFSIVRYILRPAIQILVIPHIEDTTSVVQ